MKVHEFELRSEIIAVAECPEMAGYDNPCGEIFGECHYIIATTKTGERYRHSVNAYTYRGNDLIEPHPEDGIIFNQVVGPYAKSQLENLANSLNANQPVLNSKYWTEIEPMYGSPAYVAFEEGYAEAFGYSTECPA